MAAKTDKVKPAPSSTSRESSIVLGDLDALGNYAALIDNRPCYVYREDALRWKSVGPKGRRILGERMCKQLEDAWLARFDADAKVGYLKHILENEQGALQDLGADVLRVWIESAAGDNDSPWHAVEVNPLALVSTLTRRLGAIINLKAGNAKK